jgi:hypothetical protein
MLPDFLREFIEPESSTLAPSGRTGLTRSIRASSLASRQPLGSLIKTLDRIQPSNWGQSVTVNFFDVAALPVVLGRAAKCGRQSWCRATTYGDGTSARMLNRGKTVSRAGRMFTVVGVTTSGFHGINKLFDAWLWVPEDERKQLSGDALNGMDACQGGQLGCDRTGKPGAVEHKCKPNGIRWRSDLRLPIRRKMKVWPSTSRQQVPCCRVKERCLPCSLPR